MKIARSTSESNFSAVNEEDLVSCVSCGLCLPHCPTYRVTGLDASSPRGRISIINGVRSGAMPLDEAVIDALESCVQCMGCLPACPSGVRYDSIIGPAIDEITQRRRSRRTRFTLLLAPLGRPGLLRGLTVIGAIAQRLRLVPRKLSLPPLPLRRTKLRAATDVRPGEESKSVTLFTGCVMSEWYGPVHQATIDVLESLGYQVALTDTALCCGALHRHAGLAKKAETFEESCKEALQSGPVIFNSAGCGANLLDFVPGAVDIMTFLAGHLDELTTLVTRSEELVLIHDPCHLRNVQRSHMQTHDVLASMYRTAAIPDDGLCCGAGGAYSMFQAEMATTILDRKYAAIRTVEPARFLASGNPGCSAHIAGNMPPDQSRLRVCHPVELVAFRLKSHPVVREQGGKRI
jgi:glycolate oxidase iron-sulfur subunit